MSAALRFVPMEARHGVEIRRQPSQAMQLGLRADMSVEDAEALASGREAWAALEGDGAAERIVACFGIIDTFPDAQGALWATLSDQVGAHHLAITRFCHARLALVDLPRVEAIVECADAEPVLARFPDLDAGELLAVLCEAPTPSMRWAASAGLKPSAVLRKYGAASETHMLFERIL
jgi:hypothetical protein